MDHASWIGLRDFGGVERAQSPEMCHVSCNDDEETLATFSCSAIEEGRWIEKYATKVKSSEICDTKSIVHERAEDVDFNCRKWFFDEEVRSNGEDLGGLVYFPDLQASATMNREASGRWEYWSAGEKEELLHTTLRGKEWERKQGEEEDTDKILEEEIWSKEEEISEKGDGVGCAAQEEDETDEGMELNVEIMAADENYNDDKEQDVHGRDKKGTEKGNGRETKVRSYHGWAYSGARVRFKYLAPHLDSFNGQYGIVRKICEIGKRVVIFVQPERKPDRDQLRRLRKKRKNMFEDYAADWIPCCLPDIVQVDRDGVEHVNSKPTRKELQEHYWATPGSRVTVVHKTRNRQYYNNTKGVITRIVEHNRYKYLYVALDSAELTEKVTRKQRGSKFLKYLQQPHELACKIEKRKGYVRYVQK